MRTDWNATKQEVLVTKLATYQATYGNLANVWLGRDFWVDFGSGSRTIEVCKTDVEAAELLASAWER